MEEYDFDKFCKSVEERVCCFSFSEIMKKLFDILIETDNFLNELSDEQLDELFQVFN